MPATDRAAFVNWALPWAIEASRRTKVPWPLIVAQWAVETGWGTSPMFRESRNLAGCRRASTMPAAAVRPGGTFRHYVDYAEALTDWCRCMNLTRYAAVRNAATTAEAVTALGLAGWDARGYRGKSDTNPPGTLLLGALPIVMRLAPIGAPIDAVPVV